MDDEDHDENHSQKDSRLHFHLIYESTLLQSLTNSYTTILEQFGKRLSHSKLDKEQLWVPLAASIHK